MNRYYGMKVIYLVWKEYGGDGYSHLHEAYKSKEKAEKRVYELKHCPDTNGCGCSVEAEIETLYYDDSDDE